MDALTKKRLIEARCKKAVEILNLKEYNIQDVSYTKIIEETMDICAEALKMKTTKKVFRKLLNEKYGFMTNTQWVKNAKPRKRLYGDYIYSSDKVYFDVLYNTYINTGEY